MNLPPAADAQGTFHLHVLVASGFRGAAGPQLHKRLTKTWS
jgi:hypothetical protein